MQPKINMFELIPSCHEKAVVTVKFSHCGTYLATASADKKACIFNVNNSSQPVQTLNDHTQGLNCCAWLGSRFLITGSDDKLVKCWDIETGKCISSLPGHKSFVYSLTTHPINDAIVSGGYDGSIFISDIRSRFVAAVIESHSKPVTSINFHPSGREYLTSSLDGFVRMWDFNPSQNCPCIASLYESKLTPVTSASYSPSGTQALISNFGGLLELYDITRNSRTKIPTFGNCISTFTGHVNDKYSINSEVVTDGKSSFIISGSEDDNVYIWNENGRVKQLTGHNDVVLSVAYDAGSKCLVSGCTDGSLGVWRGIELGTDSTPSRVSAEVNLFIDNQVADESNDNVDEIISMDS